MSFSKISPEYEVQAWTALCMHEWYLEQDVVTANQWVLYQENNGISELRNKFVSQAHHIDNLWEEHRGILEDHEQFYCYDFEFVPAVMIACFDWDCNFDEVKAKAWIKSITPQEKAA